MLRDVWDFSATRLDVDTAEEGPESVALAANAGGCEETEVGIAIS